MVVLLVLKIQDYNQSLIWPNRFLGRGGQPHLEIQLQHHKQKGFYWTLNKSIELSYLDFKKLHANIDRRESNQDATLLYKISLGHSITKNMSRPELENMIQNKIPSKPKTIDLLKLIYQHLDQKYLQEIDLCHLHRMKFTTATVGNFGQHQYQPIALSSFKDRKDKGAPYLWFTINPIEKKILLGPLARPLTLNPEVFVNILGAIKGSDGFYLEYRSPDDLQGEQASSPPLWVVKDVLEPSGYTHQFSKIPIQYQGK